MSIVTIIGIRPDVIRMSEVIKKLDEYFNHIIIHTGQHYDPNLSTNFYKEFNIRNPDYILECGKNSTNHYEQLSYLSREIPSLLKEKQINPDLIVFLGDSNTASVSLPLKKEGYKICHIEAGMRSGDKRMLEEINRTICDHCSDLYFVYHEDYKQNLIRENITENIFVVGNTITSVVNNMKKNMNFPEKKNNMILIDIHRPENFNYEDRLTKIFKFSNMCGEKYKLPVKLLYFGRLFHMIEKFGINLQNIQLIPLMGYREYIETIYHCKFIISDSGTGQEEPALLGTPVLVPRDFTERPQSYLYNCSKKIDLNIENYNDCFNWIDSNPKMECEWLGDESCSDKIIRGIIDFLNNV